MSEKDAEQEVFEAWFSSYEIGADLNASHKKVAQDAWRALSKLAAQGVTLSGAQLLEALHFIAPDHETDAEQLESEVTIQYGDGHSGKALYCWCADYPEEGAFVLDGSTARDSIDAQTKEPK